MLNMIVFCFLVTCVTEANPVGSGSISETGKYICLNHMQY